MFGSSVYRLHTSSPCTLTYYFGCRPCLTYINNPPYPVNAFYTAGINSNTIQNTVSAWNQSLGLQGQGVAGYNSVVALVGYNTAAISAATIPTNSYAGVDLSVFDQTNANGFSQV